VQRRACADTSSTARIRKLCRAGSTAPPLLGGRNIEPGTCRRSAAAGLTADSAWSINLRFYRSHCLIKKGPERSGPFLLKPLSYSFWFTLSAVLLAMSLTAPLASPTAFWASPFSSGYACDRSGVLFAASQCRSRDVVAPAPSTSGGVGSSHSVAAIIEELAGEERLVVPLRRSRGLRLGSKLLLDLIPDRRVDDSGMKAVVDLPLVTEPSDIDRVREDPVSSKGCLAKRLCRLWSGRPRWFEPARRRPRCRGRS
jgi:hypothetical protein